MNIPVLAMSFFMLIFPAPEKTNPRGKDLFNDRKFITASWLGYLQSGEEKRVISNIPMVLYNAPEEGITKIICIPKFPRVWNAKFKGKSKTEKVAITKTLAMGILNHALGDENFNIYALFQTSNTKKKKGVEFPSLVKIYMNSGYVWNEIGEKMIRNDSEWKKLQSDLAFTTTYKRTRI
ncbi:MAG: hypothetical protein EOO43_07295 [Flavobacterium sp.]|nr:MAG: hypothetical protein EOO43_07295 [Flavobacterium sp.]